VVSNDLSDLSRHKADIAPRDVMPTNADLVARPVHDATARLYATPACLDRLGRPGTKAGFSAAEFIEVDGKGCLMGLLNAHGVDLGAANFPDRCCNLMVTWGGVRRGMGIGNLDHRIGDADPSVERAVPDFVPVEIPPWIVARRDLTRFRRLRVAFVALVYGLRA
jgi:hypothetical protein